MKVLILGDATNPHIIKWANALYSSGIEIIIFSFRKNGSVVFKDGIEIFCIDSLYNITLKKNAALSKIFYLKAIPQLKALIKNSQPDIIHAHYASSYGFLGALMNFHPFVISVWGSDVIDFPKTSIIHKELFKFNLWKADRILSTSRFMADLISKYTSKEIFITPFGIDLELFKPQPKSNLYFKKDEIVVGCIKGLEWYYGIEYLIEAYQKVINLLPEKKIRLLIVGGGAIEQKIKSIIKKNRLEDKVLLTGRVDYKEIHKYHNMVDIFVAVSVYEESFGVAVLEASACEKPVIISRVGGMIEVVEEGVTGYIVPPRNSELTALKITELVLNPSLRQKFGTAGRERVQKLFDLEVCLKNMINIYNELLNFKVYGTLETKKNRDI